MTSFTILEFTTTCGMDAFHSKAKARKASWFSRRLLRQGDSQVLEVIPNELQMKREGLNGINRRANENAVSFDTARFWR
jgi:hypothetical protein